MDNNKDQMDKKWTVYLKEKAEADKAKVSLLPAACTELQCTVKNFLADH